MLNLDVDVNVGAHANIQYEQSLVAKPVLRLLSVSVKQFYYTDLFVFPVEPLLRGHGRLAARCLRI